MFNLVFLRRISMVVLVTVTGLTIPLLQAATTQNIDKVEQGEPREPT